MSTVGLPQISIEAPRREKHSKIDFWNEVTPAALRGRGGEGKEKRERK